MCYRIFCTRWQEEPFSAETQSAERRPPDLRLAESKFFNLSDKLKDKLKWRKNFLLIFDVTRVLTGSRCVTIVTLTTVRESVVARTGRSIRRRACSHASVPSANKSSAMWRRTLTWWTNWAPWPNEAFSPKAGEVSSYSSTAQIVLSASSPGDCQSFPNHCKKNKMKQNIFLCP